MKRFILITIILILSLSLCACQKSGKDEINNNNENIVSSEIAGEKYYTIDEMISGIYDNNGIQANSNSNNEKFYDLVKHFDGYELYQIGVKPNFVTFYYMPQDCMDAKIFDSKIGIIFKYSREGFYNESTVLEPIVKQLNLAYTDDGFIYDYDNNCIYFSIGTRRMYLIVPDSLNNYNVLKEYCQVKEITHDNSLVTE